MSHGFPIAGIIFCSWDARFSIEEGDVSSLPCVHGPKPTKSPYLFAHGSLLYSMVQTFQISTSTATIERLAEMLTVDY